MATFSNYIHPNTFRHGTGFLINHTQQQLPVTVRFHSLKPKADTDDKRAKPNSVVCSDCDGNGAVLCSQCKGNGINSIDHFNGQFKVGESCWLCGGKKDMLCGNCNGAGFIGGFMTGYDV